VKFSCQNRKYFVWHPRDETSEIITALGANVRHTVDQGAAFGAQVLKIGSLLMNSLKLQTFVIVSRSSCDIRFIMELSFFQLHFMRCFPGAAKTSAEHLREL
jgi:hypothetical protein